MNAEISACTSEYLETRVKAYSFRVEKASKGEEWGQDITKIDAKKIIQNLKDDIYHDNKEVCLGATGFLGCFLANEYLMNLFTIEEEQDIFNCFINFLENVKDMILVRGLWSLAQSKFGIEIYNTNLFRILSVIKNALNCDPNGIAVSEALQAMKSLIESIPEDSLKNISVWFPCIFPFLFHDEKNIRATAYSIMKLCMVLNQKNNSTTSILKKELTPFISQLKSEYCKKMSKFVELDCVHILKTWRLLVMVIGEDLHKGIHLINGLLEIVEKAFKSLKMEIRVEAFKCWHTLVSNFSMNKSVLSNSKRLKLLVAPFKASNTKTEGIAYMKLITWWFLVCQLEDKACDNFDLVIVPLLKYCFNPNFISNSGVNERIHLLTNSDNSCRKYSALHIKIVEVLARIISHGHNLPNYNFSINELHHPVLNSNLFLKNYQLFYCCLEDALTILDSSDANQMQLGYIILKAIMHLVVTFVNDFPNKKESVEVVKELFSTFSVIESRCNPGDNLSVFAYKFLELANIGNVALPKNVINSRLYHIPTGTKVRDLMNGTLSNFFIHKLCRPTLLHFAIVNKEFTTLWEAVLQNSKPDKLVFIETVFEELKVAVPVLCPKSSEILVSLWNITAKFLDSHIEETHTINQGDNSEHDWSSIYNTLLFPIRYSNECFSSFDSKIYESMFSIWSTLWKHFAALTPFATTAEPNTEAEFMAQKMIIFADEYIGLPGDMTDFTLTFFVDILSVIVEEFRFTELGKKPKKMLQSPIKPNKRAHPLRSLHGVVDLLTFLMGKAIRMISPKRHHIMLKLCATASKIFENIHQDRMVWPLLTCLNDSIYEALQINPTAKFNLDVEIKFVKMWNSFCCLVESRLAPKLTKDQLSFMSPLFYVALQSSHSGIRQRTRVLWANAFASTPHPIPSSLFEVLKGLGLPPASVSDILEESQDYRSKDIIPKTGSFLQKEINSKGKTVSPLSKSPKKNQSKIKKLSINEMKDEDFVKVSSPKLSRRILTPHQAEKMKSRACDIPALYNDMSQSVSQLPSQFMSQDSHDDLTLSCKPIEDPTGFEDVITEKNILSFKGVIKHNSPPPQENLKLGKSLIEKHNNSSTKAKPLKTFREKNSNCVQLKFQEPFSSKKSIAISNSGDNDLKVDVTKETLLVNCEKEQQILQKETNLEDKNGKENKRKSKTPLKKSLEDVRKILKRKIPQLEKDRKLIKSRMLKQKQFRCSRGSSSSQSDDCESENSKLNDVSPLASPLETPSKTSKFIFPIISKNIIEPESEEVIPSSQIEDFASIHVNSLERPKRTKRKSRYDDDVVYLTPTKRLKYSPVKLTNILDSTLHTDKNDSISPDKTIFKSSQPLKHNLLSNLKGTSDVNNAHISDKVLRKTECVVIGKKVLPSASIKKLSYKEQENDNSNSLSESKISEESFSLLSSPSLTPSKVTRSGRRIIAPKKDMPEPMTPPPKGGITKKISSSNKNKSAINSSPNINTVNLNNSEKISVSPSEEFKKSSQRRISDSFVKSNDISGAVRNISLVSKNFNNVSILELDHEKTKGEDNCLPKHTTPRLKSSNLPKKESADNFENLLVKEENTNSIKSDIADIESSLSEHSHPIVIGTSKDPNNILGLGLITKISDFTSESVTSNSTKCMISKKHTDNKISIENNDTVTNESSNDFDPDKLPITTTSSNITDDLTPCKITEVLISNKSPDKIFNVISNDSIDMISKSSVGDLTINKCTTEDVISHKIFKDRILKKNMDHSISKIFCKEKNSEIGTNNLTKNKLIDGNSASNMFIGDSKITKNHNICSSKKLEEKCLKQIFNDTNIIDPVKDTKEVKDCNQDKIKNKSLLEKSVLRSPSTATNRRSKRFAAVKAKEKVAVKSRTKKYNKELSTKNKSCEDILQLQDSLPLNKEKYDDPETNKNLTLKNNKYCDERLSNGIDNASGNLSVNADVKNDKPRIDICNSSLIFRLVSKDNALSENAAFYTATNEKTLSPSDNKNRYKIIFSPNSKFKDRSNNSDLCSADGTKSLFQNSSLSATNNHFQPLDSLDCRTLSNSSTVMPILSSPSQLKTDSFLKFQLKSDGAKPLTLDDSSIEKIFPQKNHISQNENSHLEESGKEFSGGIEIFTKERIADPKMQCTESNEESKSELSFLKDNLMEAEKVVLAVHNKDQISSQLVNDIPEKSEKCELKLLSTKEIVPQLEMEFLKSTEVQSDKVLFCSKGTKTADFIDILDADNHKYKDHQVVDNTIINCTASNEAKGNQAESLVSDGENELLAKENKFLSSIPNLPSDLSTLNDDLTEKCTSTISSIVETQNLPNRECLPLLPSPLKISIATNSNIKTTFHNEEAAILQKEEDCQIVINSSTISVNNETPVKSIEESERPHHSIKKKILFSEIKNKDETATNLIAPSMHKLISIPNLLSHSSTLNHDLTEKCTSNILSIGETQNLPNRECSPLLPSPPKVSITTNSNIKAAFHNEEAAILQKKQDCQMVINSSTISVNNETPSKSIEESESPHHSIQKKILFSEIKSKDETVTKVIAPSKSVEEAANTIDKLTEPTRPIFIEEVKDGNINTEVEKIEDFDLQKSEKDSPEKAAISKLTCSISTPELKKLSLSKAQTPRSRAAMMLACAKRTMKTREDNNESEKVFDANGSLPNTPTNTPPGKKRKLTDMHADARPWAKHEPSPGASPYSSILKRKYSDDDLIFVSSGEESTAFMKNRRVSFADPPVSESVEIPPSPKTLKGMRAQKKLDMTQLNMNLGQSQESQDDDLLYINPLDCSQPFYSLLVDCSEPIEVIAPLLTSPTLVESLIAVFRERDLKTVGEFCKISEAELHSLPVRAPKTSSTKKCLTKYMEILELRKQKLTDSKNIKNVENLSSGLKLDSPSEELLDELIVTPVISSKESEVSFEKKTIKSIEEENELNRDSSHLLTDVMEISEGSISASTKEPIEEEGTRAMENVLACDSTNFPPTDSNFIRSFCRHLESDNDAITSFVDGLTSETKENLFRTLTRTIPYKNIIDMFHNYLGSLNNS